MYDMCPPNKFAAQPNHQRYGIVLSCWRPRKQPRTVPRRIGIPQLLHAFFNRSREFSVNEKWRAEVYKLGSSNAKILFGNMLKFRHARWHEEALEPEHARAMHGPQFSGIAGDDPAPEADVHPAFLARRRAWVVPGMRLSGISISVVTPPAAAARVAVSNPSQSVRPGSLIWTCVSTRPGMTTDPRASYTFAPPGRSS